MKRARDIADLTLDEAAAQVNAAILTNGSTISRLEKLGGVPSGPRSQSMRRRAWCLVTLYGFDPADFDLTGDDRPGTTSDLGITGSG